MIQRAGLTQGCSFEQFSSAKPERSRYDAARGVGYKCNSKISSTLSRACTSKTVSCFSDKI